MEAGLFVAVFPGADHGMVEFTRDGGKFTYTGFAPGYFQKEVQELRRQFQ